MSEKLMIVEELLSWLTIANSEGLHGLLQRIEARLGNCVLLVTPTFDLIPMESSSITDIAHKEVVSHLRQQYFSIMGQSTDEIKTFEIAMASRPLRAFVYDLAVGKKLYGHFIVLETKTTLTDIDLTLINQVLPIFLAETIKHNEILETEKKFQDNFIYDLLHNNIASLKTIIKQGNLWGWDFSKPHQLLVANASPSDKEVPLLILKSLVSQVVSSLFKNPVVVEHSNHFLIMVPEEVDKSRQASREDIKSLAQRILKTLTSNFPEVDIAIGIGRFYPSASDLCRSYQEAKTALELGRLLGRETGVTHFDDLGLIRLLASISYEQLSDFSLEYLRGLIDYDQSNNTNLVQTLEQYLKENGDFNRTAKDLFIHPNTLRHRIRKIEEVLNIELEQYENIVNLWTALKIYAMLKDMLD